MRAYVLVCALFKICISNSALSDIMGVEYGRAGAP